MPRRQHALTFSGLARCLVALACATALAVSAAPTAHPPGSVIVISYHDVVDDVRETDDAHAVDVDRLARQFSWLRDGGYTPVSIDDIVAARAGRKALPEKAVLLTFDDGYRSVYTHLFPLLKLFNYPAVIALVGKWMDGRPGEMVMYGDKALPRERFLSWDEVREMRESGLVEVASHSYDLHRGVLGNPQGNTMPAAVTKIFDPAAGTYESEDDYLVRVRRDLARSAALIERETGVRPRAMVWPFGAYNVATMRLAESVGMPIGLTLDDGPLRAGQSLAAVPRHLVEHNPNLQKFVGDLLPVRPYPHRTVRIDPAEVYHPDPQVQDERLSALIDRMAALKPRIVHLQAFADADGDGRADALWFPNRHLPMPANLLGRIAWQLKTRAELEVFAWMPVTAFALGSTEGATQRINELYDDLGRHVPVHGVLFQDPPRADLKLVPSLDRLDVLAATTARHRAPLKMAVVASPSDLEDLVERAMHAPKKGVAGHVLDHVIVSEPLGRIDDGYVDRLAAKARQLRADHPENFTRLVLEIDASGALAGDAQALATGSARLAERMQRLEREGAVSFGYFPDSAVLDAPRLSIVKPALSLRAFPLR